MNPVPLKCLLLGAWCEPDHFNVVCNACSWILYTAAVHDSCWETAASWFNGFTPRLFVSLPMWTIFVCRDSWDQSIWMLSWHTSQTIAARRSELILDWWSTSVGSLGLQWCNEMGTHSVDTKHPQKCGPPPNMSGQESKNEVSGGDSGSFILTQHCQCWSSPQRDIVALATNALVPVSNHTSTSCQHGLLDLLVVWVWSIWYWCGLTHKSASFMTEVNSISPKLNFQGNGHCQLEVSWIPVRLLLIVLLSLPADCDSPVLRTMDIFAACVRLWGSGAMLNDRLVAT